MSKKLYKVALVIPVHNRRETTLQCLRSLSRIDKSDLIIKIFIVDDGSTDGTSQAIRERFPEVVLIDGDGTLHYAGGTNRGIESARTWEPDYIATMNDDSIFHDQFLKRMIKTAETNPHSIIGALLLLWDEPHKVFQVGQIWNTWNGGWKIPQNLTVSNVPSEAFEVECIVGNCVLFPIDAIRECGRMDEKRFPHGWGDAQYSIRMRKAGWKLFIEPKSLVWCEPNTNPTPLHFLSIREQLRILLRDERHPMNLKRQIVARWESAPSKPQAVAAFSVYLVTLAFRAIKYGIRPVDAVND